MIHKTKIYFWICCVCLSLLATCAFVVPVGFTLRTPMTWALCIERNQPNKNESGQRTVSSLDANDTRCLPPEPTQSSQKQINSHEIRTFWFFPSSLSCVRYDCLFKGAGFILQTTLICRTSTTTGHLAFRPICPKNDKAFATEETPDLYRQEFVGSSLQLLVVRYWF